APRRYPASEPNSATATLVSGRDVAVPAPCKRRPVRLADDQFFTPKHRPLHRVLGTQRMPMPNTTKTRSVQSCSKLHSGTTGNPSMFISHFDRSILRAARASRMTTFDSNDSIVACQRDAAGFFDSIDPKPSFQIRNPASI